MDTEKSNPMSQTIFTCSMTIQETHLDVFGHVNNAVYLTLFEQARWDLLTKAGYGLKEIQNNGLGPTLLELKLSFLKELHVRDQIIIESYMVSYERKVGTMAQNILRDGELCCKAQMLFGLFDIKTRKLVLPTEAWIKALGLNLNI